VDYDGTVACIHPPTSGELDAGLPLWHDRSDDRREILQMVGTGEQMNTVTQFLIKWCSEPLYPWTILIVSCGLVLLYAAVIAYLLFSHKSYYR
jgi:hypothetical protein